MCRHNVENARGIYYSLGRAPQNVRVATSLDFSSTYHLWALQHKCLSILHLVPPSCHHQEHATATRCQCHSLQHLKCLLQFSQARGLLQEATWPLDNWSSPFVLSSCSIWSLPTALTSSLAIRPFYLYTSAILVFIPVLHASKPSLSRSFGSFLPVIFHKDVPLSSFRPQNITSPLRPSVITACTVASLLLSCSVTLYHFTCLESS